MGVQAAGSAVIADAWQNDMKAEDIVQQDVSTIADSISAGLPRDRAKALRAVRETGGAYVTVTDEEIVKAIPQFAQLTGVFAEPAAVATFAGAQRAVKSGVINPDERVCLIIDGQWIERCSACSAIRSWWRACET